MVPTMINMLLNALDGQYRPLPDLQRLGYGAAPMAPQPTTLPSVFSACAWISLRLIAVTLFSPAGTPSVLLNPPQVRTRPSACSAMLP